jgi:uracil-DNA glycosylase
MVPPSLRNIYKELKNEYPDYIIPKSGNLSHWADQGILLINSILTVEA